MEKELDAEQVRVTEKIILSFIFGKDEYIEDEYTHKIHHEIFDTLRANYGKAISMDDIDNVLDALIESKYIYRFKTDGNKYKLSLTPDGQEYAFKNDYISLQDLNRKLIAVNVRSLDYTNAQFKAIMTIKEEIVQMRDDAEEKFNEQRDKINKFYTDIISIMAILIAAFSIIGINISGIKFISQNIEILPIREYVISIVTINLCIIISLFFMFLFLKKIVFPSKKKKAKSK